MSAVPAALDRARPAVPARRLAGLSHLLIPALAAAGVMFWHLGSASLTLDEGATWATARLPLRAMLRSVSHQDAVFTLYYGFIHFWMLWGGGTEVWLRLPSAAAGVACCALVAAIGTRLGGRLVGAVAGVLLALNPMFVFWAGQARPYTLAAFFVCVAALLVLRAGTRGRSTVGYAAAVWGAMATHLLSALVLLPHLVLRGSRRFRVAFAAAVIAVSPVLLLAIRQRSQTSWERQTHPGDYAHALLGMCGGTHVAAAIAVAVAALLWRPRRAELFALSWASGPLLVLVTVSLVHPMFTERYLTVALPGLALSAALGLRRIHAALVSPRWPLARTAVPAVATWLLAVGWLAGHLALGIRSAHYFVDDFRNAAATAAAAPTRCIGVDAPWLVGPVAYYLDRHAESHLLQTQHGRCSTGALVLKRLTGVAGEVARDGYRERSRARRFGKDLVVVMVAR